MNQKQIKLAKLEAKIAAARRKLNTLWAAKGYTDAEVLATGARLDALCNEYQRLLLPVKGQTLVSVFDPDHFLPGPQVYHLIKLGNLITSRLHRPVRRRKLTFRMWY